MVFLQHDVTTRQFHVAHSRGRTTLFNEDTFETDVQVKSVCVLHVDNADCSGQAIEAVVPKARFRRIPGNGKSSLAIMSLHFHYAVRQESHCCAECVIDGPYCTNTRRH